MLLSLLLLGSPACCVGVWLQFYQLLDCDTLLDFINFVKQGGYADGRIAGLLLERGADASAGIGNKCAELAGITPLHILSMWTAGMCRGLSAEAWSSLLNVGAVSAALRVSARRCCCAYAGKA